MIKPILKATLLFIIIATLSGCDYFGSWYFEIQNNTQDTAYIYYSEQLRNLEDILPTYEHGEDYEVVRLAQSDSIIIIEPKNCIKIEYGAGIVYKDFPEDDDMPEYYGIEPLWNRIKFIIIKSDTLDNSVFAKDNWVRTNCIYRLELK